MLYHYTSLEGLQGIVSSGQLWATDVAYMNDASEIKYALDIINAQIDKSSEGATLVVREMLRRARVSMSPGGASVSHYAICFCSNGDLLSQWRAYGQNGRGYSLGFDSHELSDSSYFVRRVIYDDIQQQELVGNTISNVSALLDHVARGRDVAALDKDGVLPAFAEFLSEQISEFLYAFKHPAFAEEAEWRLVLVSHREYALPHLQFRKSGIGLTPYLSIAFQPDPTLYPPLPLLDVIQGPTLHPELGIKAVHLLLEKFGFAHAELKGSLTPLRI